MDIIQSEVNPMPNSMARTRVIFVAGLMRSGSTLIDLILGAHPDIVGLGEIHQFLEHSQEYIEIEDQIQCSCGKTLEICEFWSTMIDKAQRNPGSSTQERYAQMLEVFHTVFGTQRVLVDSSKSPQSLAAWLNMPYVDVRVLYVVRDVRAWTISQIDTCRRNKEYYLADLVKKLGWKAWKGVMRKSATALFLKWYFDNRRLSSYLGKEGLLLCR